MSGETIVQGISPVRIRRDLAADVILLGIGFLTVFGYATAITLVMMTVIST